LKRVIEDKKKAFWNEVGNALGKSGSACQKAAKENNVIVFA
jgi:hypothetical protein